ncbi:MAG: sigma-70 family RNA polymerase sigma factor [Treponema sp.]|nr:sigma-70 family RNA polymerase sigma factor [Treponema sp.]
MNSDDDLLILEQILAGNKDLFRLLVKRYESAVYGMGIGFFRNAEDASDFTQEVFLKIFRSLQRFEGRSRFSTWLYKIAYNTALNSIRRKNEYRSLAEDDMVPDTDTPERVMLRKVIREAVLESISDLPERFRVCVDLFFFYDRSYQEIEMITGYPVNTVKSHVFRAKKLLRDKLGALMEGGIE